MSTTRVSIRSGAGSSSTFEPRFRSRVHVDGPGLVDMHCLPAGIDLYLVWTVTDDVSRLHLDAGLRFVNRFAYVIYEVPWTDDDTRQLPYRYD
ncbi:MAG: hypothetical protein ABL908_10110 [Hyphomicrobium sp.]